MLFLHLLFFTIVHSALTNPSRINCEGRTIDWHILVVENYHRDMNLTFDCTRADLAAYAATDELLHPSAPRYYTNSTEYCRYSRQTSDNSGTFGQKQVELLFKKMPKQKIMNTVKKLGPTTYGCSTMRYNYKSLANHAHLKLLCIYRKHAETQMC